MSKELQKPEQSSEEVDLGQLFKLIGNAFDRFFKFITSIFQGLFKVVLMLLIHFYKRFIWYVVAIVLGLVVGFIIDKNSDTLYGANLQIETNLNSARQVYENIKEFHQLAHVDKDTLELAKRLNITPNEAASLKGFYISPDLDENKMSEMYSDYVNRLDSITKLDMTYQKFKDALTFYNFRIHQIGVASTDKAIYKKIEKPFIEEIAENAYLEQLVEVNLENLDKEENALSAQISATDSLLKEYLKIRVNESKKETTSSGGTNLFMGNTESNNLIVDESKILDKRLDLEAQIRRVSVKKVENQNAINVLAGFPKTGYDYTTWKDEVKFVLPIVLLGVTLTTFILFGLFSYIKEKTK